MQSHRRPLYERSGSDTNTRDGVRLVPQTPPRLPLPRNESRSSDGREEVYSRNLLATSTSQILSPAIDSASSQESGAALTEQAVSNLSAKHLVHPASTTSTTHKPQPSDQSQSTPSSSRPLPKKRKHVKVNPDKTFFVLPDPIPEQEVPYFERPGTGSASSQATQIAHDQLSSDRRNIVETVDFSASERAGTASSTLQDSPRTLSRSDTSVDDITVDSPWNYKLVGGLRKVAKTPDLKQKAALTSDSPLPQPANTGNPQRDLNPKPSFLSVETTYTTASEDSNYKLYNSSPTPQYTSVLPPSSSDSKYQTLSQSSPASHVADSYTVPPSSSDSNYQVLGQSSPNSSEIELPTGNYQLHGDPSPSPPYVAFNSTSYASYSQESLVLPPLQPRSTRNAARFGHYKSQSRDSLRTGSLTSISSVLSQDVAEAVAFHTSAGSGSIIRIPSSSYTPRPSTWADPPALNSAKPLMQAHPHQWSSQLSTVASVSDAGTDRNSRSFSDGNGRRRSSGFPSVHSPQIPSISSSLRQEEAHNDAAYLERPQPSFARNRDGTGSTIRMVEGRDEDGDGITDMPDLGRLQARGNLPGFGGSPLPENNGRTSTMRSTTSSRANSLNAASIPVWARLYYGSGERRFLGTSGSSSDLSHSRPPSSYRSGSPDTTNFPSNIYSPRRRPRATDNDPIRPSNLRGRGSMEISPVPRLRNDGDLIHNNFARRARRPSSVWSPHLHNDYRATARHSMWESPSADWSESGFGSKRNIQVVMFIAGFILPITWMIASFLPLPPNPIFEMRERPHSSDDLDISADLARHLGPLEVKRHESAKWWRTLNRIMAVAGLAIIILIIVLVVTSIENRWAS